MISDDRIKDIFWAHDDLDPRGSYADEVNIIDFGRKIDAVVRAEERQRCIDVIKEHSPALAALL